MRKSSYQQYYDYLTGNVLTPFYNKRLEGLNELTLEEVLRKKNPYLFKAKNLELAGDLVKAVVDAFLSSREETLSAICLKPLRFIFRRSWIRDLSPTLGASISNLSATIFITSLKSSRARIGVIPFKSTL